MCNVRSVILDRKRESVKRGGKNPLQFRTIQQQPGSDWLRCVPLTRRQYPRQ